MKVDKKKTYIIYLDDSRHSKKLVVSGENLEVENGNCRITKGTWVRMGYAVFTDVMKMYDEGGYIGWYYGDHDHDKRFPVNYRFHKEGTLEREMYAPYFRIREMIATVHESSDEANLDAAKERLPLIIKERDKLVAKREKELARPWYKRIFTGSTKRKLASVEELIELYEKNMSGEKE